MSGVEFDNRELIALARDLAQAEAITPAEAGKVVTKAAVNIKRDAARRISGRAHLPAYPRSIGFDDVHVSRFGASTVVGPDKSKRQGALGNILEYGSPKRPPIPHLGPAAETEEPKFARALDALAVRVLQK